MIWLRSKAEAIPLRDGIVQTVVTSPPYWGQRDYGYEGQSGVEATYEEYLAWWREVSVELLRVTRPDGTLWLIVGDTYNTRAAIRPSAHQGGLGHDGRSIREGWKEHRDRGMVRYSARQPGFRDKDLMGLPWRMASITQGIGWYLRCDVIWAKPWGTPEKAPDRPARSHEYVFLFSRSARGVLSRRTPYIDEYRSVWPIAPRNDASGPAAFPHALARRCLEATSEPGSVVLDPFAGSGTVGEVAREMGCLPVMADLAPLDLVRGWAS